uniref:Uncharacterized protein n=2 Tax=Tetraselmis sp. GSL018 TaxID=582737 RepID=A0A061RTF2_9CHLO
MVSLLTSVSASARLVAALANGAQMTPEAEHARGSEGAGTPAPYRTAERGSPVRPSAGEQDCLASIEPCAKAECPVEMAVVEGATASGEVGAVSEPVASALATETDVAPAGPVASSGTSSGGQEAAQQHEITPDCSVPPAS